MSKDDKRFGEYTEEISRKKENGKEIVEEKKVVEEVDQKELSIMDDIGAPAEEALIGQSKRLGTRIEKTIIEGGIKNKLDDVQEKQLNVLLAKIEDPKQREIVEKDLYEYVLFLEKSGKKLDFSRIEAIHDPQNYVKRMKDLEQRLEGGDKEVLLNLLKNKSSLIKSSLLGISEKEIGDLDQLFLSKEGKRILGNFIYDSKNLELTDEIEAKKTMRKMPAEVDQISDKENEEVLQDELGENSDKKIQNLGEKFLGLMKGIDVDKTTEKIKELYPNVDEKKLIGRLNWAKDAILWMEKFRKEGWTEGNLKDLESVEEVLKDKAVEFMGEDGKKKVEEINKLEQEKGKDKMSLTAEVVISLIDFVPVVGGVKMAVEGVRGESFTGEKLSTGGRIAYVVIGIGTTVLDCVGGEVITELVKGGKLLKSGKLLTRIAAFMRKTEFLKDLSKPLFRYGRYLIKNKSVCKYIDPVFRYFLGKYFKQKTTWEKTKELGGKVYKKVGEVIEKNKEKKNEDIGVNQEEDIES